MQWGWWLRTEEWRLVGMRQMTAEPRPVMMMMAGWVRILVSARRWGCL
jgi:hypothetical protein